MPRPLSALYKDNVHRKRKKDRDRDRHQFAISPGLAVRLNEDAQRILRPRNRGTDEQREAEMKAYYAEQEAAKQAQWTPPADFNKPTYIVNRTPAQLIEFYRAMPYSEYLETDHWKLTKKAAMRRANFTCQKCKIPGKPLQVHHLTYKRLGREADNDLQSLCFDCHKAVHSVSRV